MKSSSFTIGISLAVAGVASAALFVRPPTTPERTATAGTVSKNQNVAAAPTIATDPNDPSMKGVTAKNAAGNMVSGLGVGPSPVVAVKSGARAFAIDVLAVASWGDGPSDLGRTLPSQASPEAPMSLAVDDLGNVLVLDQVNERVQIFGARGGLPTTIKIPSRTAQDLVVDPSGGLVLLDRLVDKQLIFLDATGAEKKRVDVVGSGVQEGGAVSALFASADGFWVETEHTNLVRVALPNGDADPVRPMIEGRRPNPSGPLLRAARDPNGFAVISATGSGGFLVRVPFKAPVLELNALDADAAGNVYIAGHLAREMPVAPFSLYDATIEVVALDRGGAELGRFEFPAPYGEEEQFKPIVVGKDGAIYHLEVGATAATIRRAK
jgi:hypothetical protein